MHESPTTVVVLSPGASARPLRLKRHPRSGEIALLKSLAAGPAHMTAGPVGRCSKRGWCRPVLLRTAHEGRPGGTTMFELTAVGRALIERF